MIEVVVLGASGSYGAPAGGACSGYLVRSGATAIWLDCGNGTLVNLQRHVPLEDLTAAVVSHRHPDHCVDLFGLHVALKYGLERSGVPVLAAPGVEAGIAGLANVGDTFAWDEIGDGDERQVGELRLRFSTTDHYVPTTAVECSAGDRTIVYTADTGPSWRARDAFGVGADLMICEATYQDGATGGGGHLTARQAGEMAREAGARRLMITHIWPGLDPAQSVAEAQDAFGGAVTLAAPHVSVRV